MREPIDLFALLPAVYRLRDAEHDGPLAALLGLVSEQAELLRSDLDGMWDDFFVETAAEWAVPYIGDLVSNTPLYEVAGVGRRADVAETIRWRRRKGTLAMLGDLARNVTGWGAHAVATFELLGWNQNLNHQRMQPAAEDVPGRHPFAHDRVGTVDIRSRDALDRVGGAFETITHNVDVRAIADDEGWYGIHKVCFFCFRLQSFPMRSMTPVPAPAAHPRCFHISPLGQDAPLFHLGTPLEREEAFASELNVDAPIRPYRFYRRPALDVGDGRSLQIHHGASGTVQVADILCKDLGTWPEVPTDKVAVDVRRGRIRFGATYALTGEVTVDACYGFSAPIGGGPYLRPAPTTETDPLELIVSARAPLAGFATLELAVANWLTQPPRDLRIVIADSATYTPAGGALALNRAGLTTALEVTIVAAGDQRPVVVGDITVAGTELERLTLDGIVVSGAVNVAGPVQSVVVSDCTLVPGIALDADGAPKQPARASLVCDEPTARRDVTVSRSITGSLRLPAAGNHLAVADSIVDAPSTQSPRVALAGNAAGTEAGPPAQIERSTVLGRVFVRELTLASESIFVAGTLVAERRQSGCIRFSWYEPDGAVVPRRYRCQPDLVRELAVDAVAAALEIVRVRPSFTTARYGRPAYLQLSRACAREITEGAADGAEMGVFHLLLQPYREANLRVRLEEYLPFGCEPGIVHVT